MDKDDDADTDTSNKFYQDMVRTACSVGVSRNLAGRFPNTRRAMRDIENALEVEETLVSRKNASSKLVKIGDTNFEIPTDSKKTETTNDDVVSAVSAIGKDIVKAINNMKP